MQLHQNGGLQMVLEFGETMWSPPIGRACGRFKDGSEQLSHESNTAVEDCRISSPPALISARKPELGRS
jgi:hypothetical protein